MTLGSADGKGCFFPEGLHGKINKPTGYNATGADVATMAYNANGTPKVAYQVGKIKNLAAQADCCLIDLRLMGLSIHIVNVMRNQLVLHASMTGCLSSSCCLMLLISDQAESAG